MVLVIDWTSASGGLVFEALFFLLSDFWGLKLTALRFLFRAGGITPSGADIEGCLLLCDCDRFSISYMATSCVFLEGFCGLSCSWVDGHGSSDMKSMAKSHDSSYTEVSGCDGSSFWIAANGSIPGTVGASASSST